MKRSATMLWYIAGFILDLVKERFHMMKSALAVILFVSIPAFAQSGTPVPIEAKSEFVNAPAAKAPVGTTPPASWLQDYALMLTKNGEAQQFATQAQQAANEAQLLRTKLAADMDKPSKECPNGCLLDQINVTWVPKPPAAKPDSAKETK